MLNENNVLNIYKKYSYSFGRFLRLSINRGDEEDIHQLRVTIKKIKALYNLFELISNRSISAKKLYRIYSDIFIASGKVRETQINLNILHQFNTKIPKSYIDYLVSNQREYQEEMILEIKRFEKTKLYRQNSQIYKKIDAYYDPLTLEVSTSFIEKKLLKIQKLLEEEKMIKLHKIRKLLRSIGEVLKIIYEINPQLNINDLFYNLKEIRDKIGKWHDLFILSKSLEEFSNKNKSQENEFVSIIDVILTEKEILNLSIINDLISFYQLSLTKSIIFENSNT